MEIRELLSKNLVIFNMTAEDKRSAIDEMCKKVYESGLIDNLEEFKDAVFKREELAHTALDNGIATPHAKSKTVKKPLVLFANTKEGIDFSDGEEEKSKVFFLIGVPETEYNMHIDIISKIAGLIDDEKRVEKLVNVDNYEDLINILEEEKEELKELEKEESNKEKPFIVAVTACPTGIAHTFMAKDALIKAAKELGVEIKVETNGTDGRKNSITKEDLDKAKGVILAINKSVNEERFNGYNMVKVGAKEAISRAKELITDVLEGRTTVANFSTSNLSESKTDKQGIYKHLMSGVSYMLPLVISGGILIALAFLFDSLTGNTNAGSNYGSTSSLAKIFMQIGGAAFGLFVPILSGYIAYSIADKAALASGLVAGVLATSGGSGFLGALVGGIFAGYFVKILMSRMDSISKSIRGIYLILVIPVLSVLFIGLAMIILLNPVVGVINTGLNNFLASMGTSSKIILGMLLAGMMAVDMGGPVNKAAYLFGTGTLASSITSGSTAMAAVMAGGMVPPLAIALATTIFKDKYTVEEKEAGLSNYVMGLSFITEGAIPFAASDPLRVIPACVIGSSIAGALTMLFNVAIPAPHGGILVMLLSNHIILYILSVLIGSIISALLLGLLKKKN